MPLILIRHTQLAHTQGICYGNSEIPLAESFEAEAAAVVDRVPTPNLILTSPLERCQALARKLANLHPSAPVWVEPRLREMDFGRWEGLAWDQISRAEVDLWTQDFFQARPHGGESVAMLEARVNDFLRAFARRVAQETVIAITHKGVIRAARATLGHPDPWRFNPSFGEMIPL